MARLVAAFGASHSIMLVSQREDWMHGFRAIDPKNPFLFDKRGEKTDYAALLAATPPGAAEALASPEVMSARYDQAEAAMDTLRERIHAARLDVLLIVGDDQTELFRTTHNPSIAIYWGETIRNTKREPASPSDAWVKSARMWRHEPEADRDYPVKSDLAQWLIRQLCDRDFDIAALDGLEPGQFEGHAFQFIHRRLLQGGPWASGTTPAPRGGSGPILGRPGDRPEGGNVPADPMTPVIPVILNTFDPPNQPTPRRCVQLGAALRDLIAAWPEDLRVGVIASGGLSHFVVDEALDQQVLDAIRRKDGAALAALDPKRLQAGSSEIRNWIVVGELARDLDLDQVEYIPAYRSPALTGTGLAFASWKTLE
ncbi:MAG: protocatechuate 3,4-dioxygenase [Burkholderiaceae bacterium]|nr:protocatechuate 3,4-dioxygenase [Burkholderiaceae bacterium]